MDLKEKAFFLLKEWKNDSYINGLGVLDQIGKLAENKCKTPLIVCNLSHNIILNKVIKSLSDFNITPVAIAPGAKPNSPREDVYRLATWILNYKPDGIIAIGGGSTIDAVKAAIVLSSLGKKVTPEIDYYLGSGIVSKELKNNNLKLLPLIAISTTASSGSHLTKYANITDTASGQKKLIVDEKIVPIASLFDYDTTATMPLKVTIDGILDAISHTFEVYWGNNTPLCKNLALITIELCLKYAPILISNPYNLEAREAIGLATDLGGYAIMIGGTSGAHLNSFSFVKLTGHGTACGIMNPYYSILFSRAIKPQLEAISKVFKIYGFERDTVAEAMIAFSKSLNAPTTLQELPNFDESYITK
ncbi:MAG: iron-containing alcohol dehydrogenase, partial [Sphaerochaetaceae bacterium]